MTGFRLGISLLAATALTSGMFFFLRALIGAEVDITALKPAARIEFSRLRRDTDVATRREDKAKLELRSQVPTAPLTLSAGKGGTGVSAPLSMAPSKMGEVDASIGVKKLMIKAGGSDRDVIPLVRIEPEYPPNAVQRGIEGWVLVRFTITAAGMVKDAVVVDSSPKRVFDAAAVAAVLRWKYNPKIEEGVAVERRGIQVLLRFSLEKEE